MKRESGMDQSEADANSDYESVRAFNNKNKKIYQTQRQYESIDNLYVNRLINVQSSDKQHRTLTTSNTPIRKRQLNRSIILERRNNLRNPVSLTPSKFQLNDLRSQNLLSTSQKFAPQSLTKPSLIKKGSINVPLTH